MSECLRLQAERESETDREREMIVWQYKQIHI